MRYKVKVLLIGLAAVAVLGPLPGDEPAKGNRKTPLTAAAWTLDEALEQLRLYPRDAYLQYVVMQLARREGRQEEIAKKLTEELFGAGWGDGHPRVDLFSLFAGTLAIQEGLQLEAMREPEAGAPRRRRGERPVNRWRVGPPRLDPGESPELERTMVAAAAAAAVGSVTLAPQGGLPGNMPWQGLTIATEGDGNQWNANDLLAFLVYQKERKARKTQVRLADLQGPWIKSHPWKKLLAGKKPDVSFLSRCVPDDFYLAEFTSLSRMLQFLETSEQWGTYLYQQGAQDARTSGLRERYLKQLALESSDLLRPFYDVVVEEVGVTGSDPFFTEGTDVTLLFRLKQPDVFQAQMRRFLTETCKARPDAKLARGEILGIGYDHLATPRREVCVYAAYPAPGMHVRSNSEVALRRILEAIKGKDAGEKAVRRLGDTNEYKYIRTLLPRAAGEEDGFIYLSDPFIRHVVGPRLKLTERRRLISYNHLCMIGHAAQLYRTETGKPADSLATLAEAGCCPAAFNKGELRCPFGGTYSLAADGLSGVCSRCGTARFLTPCGEINLDKVSKFEADEYQEFVKEYSEFWKTFFDPIALRIQVTPRRYKVETLILPLVDNSIYTELAKVFGGKPEPLDALPLPKRVLFSLAARLNKEALIQELKPLIGLGQVEELEKNVSLHVGAFFTGSLQMGLPASLPCAALGTPDEKTLELYDAVTKPEWQTLVITRKVEKFLTKGIGNQVAVHIYDVPLTFDAGLEAFFGEALAQAAGRTGESSEIMVAVAATAAVVGPWFFAPTYISLPVKDAGVVDQFLDDLDALLIPLARKRNAIDPGVPISLDYYKIATRGGVRARSGCLRFGPLRVRAFWARIGDALYIANQPSVLSDIQAAAAGRAQVKGKAMDNGPTAHLMVRLRPRSWDQALEGFRLTWAENSRDACLHNLGPLSSAARAFTAAPGVVKQNGLSWDSRSSQALRYAEKLYGLHFTCPEGGHYVLSKDGKMMTCSMHGWAKDPRQEEAPAKDSPLARLLGNFADLTASVTFREDGLHAVLIIERK
jgi:hypothetical protein